MKIASVSSSFSMLSNRILGGNARSAQRSGTRRASGTMRVPVSGGAVESGVRPEESNPWGRGSSGSYAARWGACAWPLRKEDPGSRSEEAVCVWGGAPCADEREILLLPVDPNGKRRRIQSTGEHPRARESAGVAAVKRGASIAHVVYGGFAQDAAAASAASDPPGAEGEPLGDAFLIDGNMRWRSLVPFGNVAPPPRGGHALVPIASNKAFVFGGRGADGEHLGDAWILELHSTASVAAGWSGKNVDARWEQSPVRDRDAPAPAPREAAGAAFIAPSKSAGENARWTSIGNMVRQLDPKSRTQASGGGRSSAQPGDDKAMTKSPSARGDDGDDKGDKSPKGDESYGGKRGEVWIFGGCDESGVFDDVWRYDVDTCAWHPTRRPTGTTAADAAARASTRGQGAGGRGGSKAAADGESDGPTSAVAWPPGRFGHAVVVVPARELDPTAAARLRIADESPCMVIHGGCGADGGVLNDVWAFSFQRERWTLLSGESPPVASSGDADRRGRVPAAGVPESAPKWIDAPGRCAHGCVYVAGALRVFGGIASSTTPASVHESVNVYLSATAAERARDRGAVFGPRLWDVVDAEKPALPPSPVVPQPPRGRTLAGLEPPPADTLNASLDINTEDGGDQGARLTALKGLRWIDGEPAGRKKRKEETPAPPPAGADVDAEADVDADVDAGIDAGMDADVADDVNAGAEAADAKTPSPDASTDFEFGGEGDVDVGVGKYRDEIGAAMAHIAATGRLKSSKRRVPPPASEGQSPVAKPTTSTRTEDLPPTVIKPRRNRALPPGDVEVPAVVAEEEESPDSALPEEAALGGGRGRGRVGGGRGGRAGGRGGRGRGRGAKPAGDAPVPEAHWLAPDAVKPIAAPGVRVVSEGSMSDDDSSRDDKHDDEADDKDGDSENARALEKAREAEAKAAAAAERAARLKEEAARAAAEAAAAAAAGDDDDDDEDDFRVVRKGFGTEPPVHLDDTHVNGSRGSKGKHRWSAVSVGPTPPSLKGRFQEAGAAWASAGLEVIKDTPPAIEDNPKPAAPGVGKTPEEKVAEAEDDQELNTHAYDLFCVWRRMSRDDEESDVAITAAWDAMDPELKLHFFEQARIARSGGEADVTFDAVRNELKSTAGPDAGAAVGETPHTATRVLRFDAADAAANPNPKPLEGPSAEDGGIDEAGLAAAIMDVDRSRKALATPEEDTNAERPPAVPAVPQRTQRTQRTGLGVDVDGSLLGKKFEDGEITGGFEAGYFLSCVVDGVRCRGVLFSPVLALQKCAADGTPVVVLPSYCDPGRMVYDGALQSVVFADDEGRTKEVWGEDYRNPQHPGDTTVKGRAAQVVDGGKQPTPAPGADERERKRERELEPDGAIGAKGEVARPSPADLNLRAKESADGSAPSAPAPAPVAASPAAPAPGPAPRPASQPEKRGRGRPKGSKNKTPGEKAEKTKKVATNAPREKHAADGVATKRGPGRPPKISQPTPPASPRADEGANALVDPLAAPEAAAPAAPAAANNTGGKRPRGRPKGSGAKGKAAPGAKRARLTDGALQNVLNLTAGVVEDIGAVVGHLSSDDDDDVPIAAMVPSAATRPHDPDPNPNPSPAAATVPMVPTVDGVPVKRPRGRPKGYRPSLMKKKPPPPPAPASPTEAQDDEVDFEVDGDDDDEPILRPSGTLDDVVERMPVKRKPGRPKQSRAKGSLE